MKREELDNLNRKAKKYADKKACKTNYDYWKGLLQGYLDCSIELKNNKSLSNVKKANCRHEFVDITSMDELPRGRQKCIICGFEKRYLIK